MPAGMRRKECGGRGIDGSIYCLAKGHSQTKGTPGQGSRTITPVLASLPPSLPAISHQPLFDQSPRKQWGSSPLRWPEAKKGEKGGERPHFDSKEPFCPLVLHEQACPALPELPCPGAHCPAQMLTAGILVLSPE